ncbi:MAG: type II toxin-antitoxin system RelE/ParE family toxin [bacterium]|nr:type II toxin-antitoxin system RelE/ParE family toxin [bacterium]
MTPYILHPEVRKFLKPLSLDIKSKVGAGLFLLQEYGRLLPPPDSKKISGRIFELRIRASVQIRLLYGFSGGVAFVVHGFVKKSNKIAPRELRLAEKRFAEFAE